MHFATPSCCVLLTCVCDMFRVTEMAAVDTVVVTMTDMVVVAAVEEDSVIQILVPIYVISNGLLMYTRVYPSLRKISTWSIQR